MSVGYGVPIPKTSNMLFDIKETVSLNSTDWDTYMNVNIYDTLVGELPDTATKFRTFGSGDDGSQIFSISCPDLFGASSFCLSYEGMIGIKFQDKTFPTFSTKGSGNWSRMYMTSPEPDLFFIIRPEDNYTDGQVNSVSYSYSNDRIIIYAQFSQLGGGNSGYKVVLDIKYNAESWLGFDIDMYYMNAGVSYNPYVWFKIPNKNNNDIEVVSKDRNIIKLFTGAYGFKKFSSRYNEEIEYITNVVDKFIDFKDYKFNSYYEHNHLYLKSIEEYTKYSKINKFREDYIPEKTTNKFNYSTYKNIIESQFQMADELLNINKISKLASYKLFNGFVEGKTKDDKIYGKVLNSLDYGTVTIIDSFEYNFPVFSTFSTFKLLIDGRLRELDVNKPMLKGYISGKINTSGCSGQDFIIRCYRHSNNDFIGEYKVDSSGNYFIPNLNYLDEYDIMLVDKNSVIETKVSSKRKPILNDEIRELKLETHTSTLNTDLLILFEFSLLKFSYNNTTSPYVQDDATYTPKPYEMYYNISTSYPSYIRWWDAGQKYYMNSNAHIADVRYIDNKNIINPIINSNAEFEISVTFNHFGHNYSQWNALFACSDSTNQGNFLYIYNDQIYFGAYNKSTNVTHSTEYITISRYKVYTATIRRKGRIVTITVSDAITLSSPVTRSMELPSDFVWDFSKIKLGCAWGGSQFWGDFVDFEFKVL